MKEKYVVPIWDIFSCKWIDHTPNPRFAIYHPSTVLNTTPPGPPNSLKITSNHNPTADADIVFDKETRLIWERSPNTEKKAWDAAIVYSVAAAKCNRKGWRLPAIEELLSLVDPTQHNPTLPTGHPFINVQLDYFYWSSSLGMSLLPDYAWGYNFGNADTSNVLKSANCYIWLVRGGYGHDYPY